MLSRVSLAMFRMREREAVHKQEEVARLTAALHAAKAHPDFSYIVIPPSTSVSPSASGWEPSPETPVAPGDTCWRRRAEKPNADV
jgi:hypothetical protein